MNEIHSLEDGCCKRRSACLCFSVLCVCVGMQAGGRVDRCVCVSHNPDDVRACLHLCVCVVCVCKTVRQCLHM